MPMPANRAVTGSFQGSSMSAAILEPEVIRCCCKIKKNCLLPEIQLALSRRCWSGGFGESGSEGPISCSKQSSDVYLLLATSN